MTVGYQREDMAPLSDVTRDNGMVGPGAAPRTRTIQVARGMGGGPTKIAAFDAALRDAGVANFNLIVLSSVIPPRTVVKHVPGHAVRFDGQWGDRLYVVMAQRRVDEPGQEGWAGVGWVQAVGSNKGLFVECEASSEDRLRADLESSLESMAAGRADSFGPPEYVTQGVVCEDQPVCALVVAVYETAPWSISGSDPTIVLP
ncbi:MAG TPA: pyruvoyl-dependent arginine decarboxylase [bacterium]|nr:pyruvoyl-dependent arginine decarboxylase [bacterium]